jgi:hypothetical protein
MRTHRYAVGQHVSYAEAYPLNDAWRGPYEMIFPRERSSSANRRNLMHDP